ncbi:hypothetical protein [Paenibacillus sp. MMS18-CY102]|uniref:hypothetical protein n=1 Tax=Paenibacillus sp. MMS18-CY102 TaxID=2682849 RepID=UPI0013662F3C|nr:hypothetical protein [Paenibacillus sp. MMS18-CY102]MWC30400.1 hypothetical protein [Paenibacillus sp. MMS18-CY102]
MTSVYFFTLEVRNGDEHLLFCRTKKYRTRVFEAAQPGKWISIDKWTKSDWAILYPEKNYPIWNVEFEDMVFTERNYDLFAILANQRNSENMPYISDPRGLPEDVSPEIPLQIRNLECHSTTWFTAKELFEFNWNQVFEYEDENMAGEKIYESVNYMECGYSFLESINRVVGRKDPAEIRIIITFNN